MKIKILFFGITRDLVNQSSLLFNIEPTTSVEGFKVLLLETFPKLKNYANFTIAVNETYADNNLLLQENDIVAIIPPVSGG